MQPLSSLYLFPVYQTRDEYETKTGVAAPPFNPAWPVKSWADPAAANSPKRSVVYENVLALADSGKPLVDGEGRPMLEPLMMPRERAAVVNIPVKDFTGRIPETATIGFEVPVPCRALVEDEQLTLGFGDLVYVERKSTEQTPTSFSVEDRQLLHAIAKKLGV